MRRQVAICEWSAAVSYAFRMAEPVYGIDDFPDDDSLWRVEWIGGVGYNTSVPSDPRITVCLMQLPPGETNPLSARARFPASTPSGGQGSDLVWRPVQGCAQVYVCPAPWQ